MSAQGAVLLDVPASLLRAATWRLRMGPDHAGPGEPLAAAAGARRAVVTLRAATPRGTAALRLRVPVFIEPGRTTRLRLPLHEGMARWLAAWTWPVPETAQDG